MGQPYSTIGAEYTARISLFSGASGNEPLRTMEFGSIAAMQRAFARDSEAGEKRQVPLYSRCIAVGGREREDLIGPFLVILDVDGSDVPMEECSDRLTEIGVSHFCHTTWSHDPDDPLDLHRYRVVADFLCEDWRTVAGLTRTLADSIGITVDPVSSHQICFYLPACPEGGKVTRCGSWSGETTWLPDPSLWDDIDTVPNRDSDADPQRDPDTINVEELREALRAIPNESREQWIRTGQCLHASGLEIARSLWDEWSAGQDYGAYSDDSQDATWNSFRPGRLTVTTVFWDARENGWRPTSRDRSPARDEFDAVDAVDPDGDGRPGRAQVLLNLNRRYAFVAVGQGRAWDHDKSTFVSKSAFLDLWLHPEFPTGRERAGVPELQGVGATWWGWEHRNSYSQIDFAPPGGPELPSDVLNLWRGWGVAPNRDPDADLFRGCERFLSHVHEVVCTGDDEHFRWIVAWMAHLVQRPWEKPGTAIVMRSGEGTGKGMFARALCTLAGSHGFHVSQPSQLTGRFTQHLANKIVVFADEVTWGGRRQEEGVLKALITEPTMVVEAKGVDATSARSYCRMIIASNQEWVVPAGPSARRFFVLDVSESRRRETRYFERIAAELEDGGLAALHGWLLSQDLSKLPDPRQIIQTRGLLRQKIEGLDSISGWIVSCLQSAEVSSARAWEEEKFWLPKRELYQSYLDVGRDTGDRYRSMDQVVMQRLYKLLGGKLPTRRGPVDGEDPTAPRPWEVRLPGLAEARGLVDAHVGQAIEWQE